MNYSCFYPGGWKSGESGGTPITPEALNHMEEELQALDAHMSSEAGNPHKVSKTDVGLGNVPNVATDDQTPTYKVASTLAMLVTGERLSVAFGKIAKAVADLIAHLTNKSNPHDVSAPQIGAYPNTGGKITGSIYLSNTYDNGSSAVYKNNSATSDHGLNLLDYAKDGSVARLILCKSSGKAEVTLDNGASYEDIMLSNYNTTYHAWSKKVSGEAQWLNPPMILGTEYCTMEHCLGKQVYTKVFNGGAISDGAEIDYPGIAADTITVVRANCTLGSIPMAQRPAGVWATSQSTSDYFACYYVAKNAVTVNCGSKASGNVYVQIWYTKN